MKNTFFAIFAILIIVLVAGCDFENPYVPDYAGSSSLTGRIVTDPVIDLTGTEIVLRGQKSSATVTGADGIFYFRDMTPGDYSLQIQKKPYLLDSFPVSISKATDDDLGDIKIGLKGAIAGNIPNDKIPIVRGEVEVIVYIDGVPLVPQEDSEGELTIDLSSPESSISIRAETKISVYVDSVPYSAVVTNDGNFIVEFVPQGIYNDIRIQYNSEDSAVLIGSGGPVVVKSGQTRLLTTSTQ